MRGPTETMTFSAIDKDTNQRYTSKTLLDLGDSMASVQERLISPITLEPVRPVVQHLRRGKTVRAHFRHIAAGVLWPEDVFFDDEYGRIKEDVKYVGSESQAHLNGKLLVATKAHEIFSALKQNRAEYEKRIEIPGTGRYRIIDVAFVMKHGDIVANEIQISPITPDELTERTNDYRQAGISEVMWWFGEKADTPANRKRHMELTDYSAGTVRTVVREEIKTIRMNLDDDY